RLGRIALCALHVRSRARGGTALALAGSRAGEGLSAGGDLLAGGSRSGPLRPRAPDRSSRRHGRRPERGVAGRPGASRRGDARAHGPRDRARDRRGRPRVRPRPGHGRDRALGRPGPALPPRRLRGLGGRADGWMSSTERAGAPLTDLVTDGEAVLRWAASYLERVRELPVLAQVKPGEIRSRLPAHPPEEPEPFSAVLSDFEEILLPGVTHWQHPRYFAYFANTATEPAILAELLAATLNSV